MDKTFNYPVGSTPLDQQVEFRAFSIYVDNPTNQWLRLDSLGVTVSQYTIGTVYPLPGTLRAQASFTAPIGQAEPPTIAGQSVTLMFSDEHLPLSAGVGMLGGRAPYYDRNMIPRSRGYIATGVAPHGATVRASYTVPAGKKSFFQGGHCGLARDVTSATPVLAKAYAYYTPILAGETQAPFIEASHLSGAVGAAPDANIGSGGAMVVNDICALYTSDGSTGGSYSYDSSFIIGEFDA